MSHLRIDKTENSVVVGFSLNKIVDLTTIEAIGDELVGLCEGMSDGAMILDFVGVQSASSALFGKLLLVRTECESRGFELRLCAMGSDLMEAFKMLNLHTLFTILPDREAALESI